MDAKFEWQAPLRKKSKAKEFRAQARGALKGHRGAAFAAVLLVALLGGFAGWSILALGIGSREIAKLFSGEFVEWVRSFPDFKSLAASVHDHVAAELTAFSGAVLTVVITFAVFLALLLWCLFLGAPIRMGYARFGLNLIDGSPELSVKNLFRRSQGTYGKTVAIRVLRGLCACAWLLLALLGGGLILAADLMVYFGELPGYALWIGLAAGGLLIVFAVFSLIRVSLRFALCPYILAEYPDFSPMDVLRNSSSLMKGNKLRLFRLRLSFFGWYLLVPLTAGLILVYLAPYLEAAETAFYDEISGRSMAKEMEFPSIDLNDYVSD